MAMEKPEAKVAFEADFIPLDSGSEDDLFCGVPDSEEYASPAFLAAYAAELRSLRASASSATPATPAETGSANSNIVVEDTSGFDCRIGERSNVQGVGVAHLNRLVKHRHKPASGDAASGAGDKRKRKSQGPQDARPSKLRPLGSPQPDGAALPGDSSRHPLSWPPGWEVRIRPRKDRGGETKKTYYSPNGIQFTSMIKLRQRCADLGLPPEVAELPPSGPQERFEDSALGLRRWLARAGALGCLPPSQLLPCAAMRVRRRTHKPEAPPQF